MAARRIVVLGTMDTKGREMEFLRAEIEEHRQRALLVDTGVVGRPHGRADLGREEVAAAGGTPLAQLLANPRREVAARVMAAGATAPIKHGIQRGEVNGSVSG